MDKEERWEVFLCFGSYVSLIDIFKDFGFYEMSVVFVFVYVFFFKMLYFISLDINYII